VDKLAVYIEEYSRTIHAPEASQNERYRMTTRRRGITT